MNKTNNRKFITFVLLSALVLSFVLFAISFNLSKTKNAMAEPVTVTGGIADSGFFMEKGVQIKRVGAKNEYGIRWITNVSAEFEEYLSTTYENATFAYKTLVTGVNQLENGLVTELVMPTGESNVSVLPGNLDKGQFRGSIIYADKEGNTTAWEEIADKAYQSELIARACVVVTPESGEPVIIYAKAEDSQRSMRAVAVEVYNTSTDEEEKTDVRNYFGDLDKIELSNTSYYNYLNGENTVKVGNVADGKYIAYIGAKKLGVVTVTDGVANLGEINLEKGNKEYNLHLFDINSNVSSLPFVNPTAIFTKASDLSTFGSRTQIGLGATQTTNFYNTYDGYYVLANDIDASSYTTTNKRFWGIWGGSDTEGVHASTGLMGTFDGQGHIVSGMITEDGGLFGIVGTKGVIKNVAFTDVRVTKGYGDCAGALAAVIEDGATLENVYVSIASQTYATNGNTGAVAYAINERTNMRNVVVEFNCHEERVATTGMFHRTRLANPTKNAYNSTNWSNVYYVSNQDLLNNLDETGVAVNQTIPTDGYGFNGIYKYATVDDLRNAYYEEESVIKSGIDSFDTNLWVIAQGVPYFKGVHVPVSTEGAYDFDQSVGKLSSESLTAIFGTDTLEITDAEEITGEIDIEVGLDNALTFRKSGNELVADGSAYIVNFTTTAGNVQTKILPVTKIFTQASDFDMFVATTASIVNTGSIYYPTYNGYYVLGNDIPSVTATAKQFEGLSGQETNAHSRSGLMGTFDGRGHTIGTVRVGAGGLFGIVGSKGVVKNVAFKHFAHSTTDWRGGGLLGYCVYAGATIENVYIETETHTSNKHNSGLLAYSVNEKATFKNVLIKSNIPNVNDDHNAFAFRIAHTTATKGVLNDTNWSNFFIITVQNLCVSGQYLTAENETLDANKYGVKGLYKYADATALTDAYNAVDSTIKTKIDSFDTNYWTITNGVPTWKVVS